MESSVDAPSTDQIDSDWIASIQNIDPGVEWARRWGCERTGSSV